ncbi:MAG: hypothetical protein MJK18_10995 [Bdellovibrionales bacterium]|nr:hypothetical protein [Bdellovibrionales bacterium]
MAFKGCQSLEETDRFNNESFMYSSKFVRRSIETEEPDNESAKKGDELAIDQRSVAPKFMGLGASLMADICANQPEDLFHTTLIRLWNDNFFEEKDRELQVTAYAMMKFHYPQYFLDKVWDGSKSSPKAKRLKAHV